MGWENVPERRVPVTFSVDEAQELVNAIPDREIDESECFCRNIENFLVFQNATNMQKTPRAAEVEKRFHGLRVLISRNLSRGQPPPDYISNRGVLVRPAIYGRVFGAADGGRTERRYISHTLSYCTLIPWEYLLPYMPVLVRVVCGPNFLSCAMTMFSNSSSHRPEQGEVGESRIEDSSRSRTSRKQVGDTLPQRVFWELGRYS